MSFILALVSMGLVSLAAAFDEGFFVGGPSVILADEVPENGNLQEFVIQPAGLRGLSTETLEQTYTQVWRPVSGTSEMFTLVYSKQTPVLIQLYASFPVLAGDRIGFTITGDRSPIAHEFDVESRVNIQKLPENYDLPSVGDVLYIDQLQFPYKFHIEAVIDN